MTPDMGAGRILNAIFLLCKNIAVGNVLIHSENKKVIGAFCLSGSLPVPQAGALSTPNVILNGNGYSMNQSPVNLSLSVVP